LTLGEDVVIVQIPGPCSGMTATGESGLTSPSTSLLATLSSGALALALTVKFVVMADSLFGTGVAARGATLVVGVVGFVALECAGAYVVVVFSSVVVVTTCATFAGRSATWVFVALGRVIIMTMSSSGLEYISKWAPRGRRLGLVMVLEG
jgi:hypothetical protein